MNNEWSIGDRPDDGAFIHSELDDYGLTPIEFRVYCRILRRAGTKSVYYEGNASAARLMRMSEKSLKKAILALEEYGMIWVERRPGQTHIISPTHRSRWMPPSNIPRQNRPTPVPKETEPTPSNIPRQNRPTPVPKETEPTPSNIPRQNRPHPKETEPPLPKETDEGIPSKEIPLRSSLSLSGSRARENPEPDPEEREGLKIPFSPDLGSRVSSYPPEPEEDSRTTPDDRIPASPKLESVGEVTGGGQISSAGGGPQKKLPPWRLSWADGDYEPGFLDYYARIMGEYYQQTKRRSDAIAVIASRETAGETGILHAKWVEYLAEKEGRPVIDITVAAQQDAARLAAIKGNPEAQRAAMVSGPPPTAPVAATTYKSEYEKAVEAAQKGDLGDALTLIHGHTRALRITSAGVIALLQGEGLISDTATTLDRLSDNGILAVLDYLNDRFKEKFGGA